MPFHRFSCFFLNNNTNGNASTSTTRITIEDSGIAGVGVAVGEVVGFGVDVGLFVGLEVGALPRLTVTV